MIPVLARTARKTATVAVLVAAAGFCLGAPGTTAAARSGSASRIVFAANRLPEWYGEIYRVTAAGTRVDLSKSPAADIAPAVSPDGRSVAFLSARGGSWALYIVGTNGRGLRRISGSLLPAAPEAGVDAQIVWAPDSHELAAEVGGQKQVLYLGTSSGPLRRVATGVSLDGSPVGSFAWSADGRFLVYSTQLGDVDVISSSGARVWSTSGAVGAAAWSAGDRLAVSPNSTNVAVYDKTGRLVTRFAGHGPAWSPNGKLLASFTPYALQIRPNGLGTPTVRFPIRNGNPIQWVGSSRVAVFGATGWVGFDVAQNRPWNLGSTATAFNTLLSPDGQITAERAGTSSSGTSLVTSHVGSGLGRTVVRSPWCPEQESYADLARIPRSNDVLYQSDCEAPSADIYSVKPDGSGLRHLTNTPTDEMEPSLSSDGANVVYVQQLVAGKCDGCPQTLWHVPTNGGTPQQLTSHTFSDPTPFDENPTWSPDSTQIAFQNSGANAPIRLLVIPASGGSARDLHVKGAALPIWGPKQLAVANWSVPKLTIETVDPATGTTRVVATGGRTDADALAWSTSGRLAYLYDNTDGQALIAVAGTHAKPLNLSALLPPHSHVAGLAWSPDGTRFAFAASDANGIGEIYTVATNGTGLREITTNIGALDNVPYESTLSWR